MRVRAVRSDVVSASNGGCNAFNINRSLALAVTELNPVFCKSSLSTLALGIIATQPSLKDSHPNFRQTDFSSMDLNG